MGGKDETLNRMPDGFKIDLVNYMARAPACWSAATTLKKTESYVSTQRHELSRKRRKASSSVNTQPQAHTHAFVALHLPTNAPIEFRAHIKNHTKSSINHYEL